MAHSHEYHLVYGRLNPKYPPWIRDEKRFFASSPEDSYDQLVEFIGGVCMIDAYGMRYAKIQTFVCIRPVGIPVLLPVERLRPFSEMNRLYKMPKLPDITLTSQTESMRRSDSWSGTPKTR